MTRTPRRDRGDYQDEMLPPHLLDEDAVEALLTGRPVQPELAPLAGAVGQLRTAARQPARPSAELARRMAGGDFTGVTPAPLTPAPSPRRLRSWLAGVSPRVRVVTGAVVVFTGLSAATGAGALPGGAQAHVESFIETVTPISFEREAPGTDVVQDVGDTGAPPETEDPGEPVIPPGTPETPPGKPEKPDNPNKPETPPGKPETPPGKPPEKPDNPNKPETPPGKPENPGSEGNGNGNSGNSGNGQGNAGNGNSGNGNGNGP